MKDMTLSLLKRDLCVGVFIVVRSRAPFAEEAQVGLNVIETALFSPSVRASV